MGELSVRELPLFPLPEVVLFPQEVLPLHIFESRYRIMLQSVLETDSMFGVIKWDPTTKSMANVGCCAQIIKHQTAEDGRSNIITLGQQRFQVLEIIRTTPFYSAMVSWINDEQIDNLQKLDSLKDSVQEALNDSKHRIIFEDSLEHHPISRFKNMQGQYFLRKEDYLRQRK